MVASDPSLRLRVERILRYYLENGSAVQRSPLTDSKLPVQHVRVSLGVRLIDMRHPTDERCVLLLWIDRHDRCNDWGIAYTGRVENEVIAMRIVPEANGLEAPPPPPIGNVLGEDVLRALGVPDEQVALVRELQPHELHEHPALPVRLTRLIATRYTALRDHPTLPRRVPGVAHVPLTVTPTQLPAIATLRVDELFLQMSEEQRQLVDRRARGTLVVKGAAGSGKTIVGIRRVERWLSQSDLIDDRPVLYTCFNRVLMSAVAETLNAALLDPTLKTRLEVKTIYDVMLHELRERLGIAVPRRLTTKELQDHVALAMADVPLSGRVQRWSVDDVRSEITEVIYGRALTTEDKYKKADRSGVGAGRNLDESDRAVMWSIYRRFRTIARQCEGGERVPWDWIAARLVHELERDPPTTPRWRGIVIDEVQDLSPAMVRALQLLQANRPEDIIALGDAAQNIFRYGFRWKHLGLVVEPANSRTLKACFRSTKQIVGAARGLVAGQSGRFEEDLVLPEAIERSGPKVRIYREVSGDDEAQRIALLIDEIVNGGAPYASVGVLVPDRECLLQVGELLETQRIPFERIERSIGSSVIQLRKNTVKLTTPWHVKGLEFPYVIVSNVDATRYPVDANSPEESDRVRRQLYMAMTRAAYSLSITCVVGSESKLLDVLDNRYIA